MLVAKKRLPPSPLIVVKSVTRSATAESAYKIAALIKKPAPETKSNLDHLPFDKWNIPEQEDGYIKGRENDFL